jgi:hypothetical protein
MMLHIFFLKKDYIVTPHVTTSLITFISVLIMHQTHWLIES